MTSPLERIGRWSPYHRNGNSCSSFAWCSLVDCFIHKSGNYGAVVTARRRARDSAEGAEPMCALLRRQSLLRGEGNPARLEGTSARLEASPSLLAWSSPSIRDALSRRGPSRGGENPREARQAWRAWSLARSSEGCRGPWQAGPWYPGFQCADNHNLFLK